MLLKKGPKRKIRTTVVFMLALVITLVSVGGALAVDTDWTNPMANTADTGDGFETLPNGAHGVGGDVAVNSTGTADSHFYRDYNISIPTNVPIHGIEVQLDWFVNNINQAINMQVQLSWDGGTNWTPLQAYTNLSVVEVSETGGSPTDTWGHVWNGSQFSNNTFRVRVICNASIEGGTFYLNWIPVKVYYTPNQPPVVSDIPNQTIAEGGTFATINLDDYVSDVDNTDDQMAWTYSGDSNLTVDIANRVATITPKDADWNGSETITFRATDPGSLFDEDSATFTVTAVNDAPVVTGIPDETIAEGGTFATINLDAYIEDVDNTDAQMAWTYSGDNNLTVDITDRVATITPKDANWNGDEEITFKATDPDGLFDSDAAILAVTAVNDAPVVSGILDQTIDEGDTFTTVVLDTYVDDVDNTDAQMTWTYSGNGELTITIDGNRVATIGIPYADWYGSETITFRATDPGSLFNEDSATFAVTAVNDAPVVSNIPSRTIVEGDTFTTVVLDTYVSDVDNTDAEMTWSYSGNGATAVITG